MNSPTLVVVCGLPGTGKTTVAEAVVDRLDAQLLRTDVVRKDLFSAPAYTDAETDAVYEELFSRATRALDDGHVVLDATFRTTSYRDAARATARDAGVDFRLVHVECDDAVVRDRIRGRTDDESDADVEVYELFREEYEPVAEPVLVVDNSGDLGGTFAQLDALFPRSEPVER